MDSRSTKHTPTPWIFLPNRGEYGTIVDDMYGHPIVEMDWPNEEGDAAFIVRACNSHDQLVEALRGGRVAIDVLMAQLIEVDPSFKPTQSAAWPMLVAITNALAAAEA